jgi:RimJ/RimL family protein N-acetyltransferase
LDLADEPDVYETGFWVAPKYAGQGMATEAANATIRYAFGHLGAKAASIGYFDGNEPSPALAPQKILGHLACAGRTTQLRIK